MHLDVRAIPTWERHPKIFSSFDALVPGQSLVLTSDHEPRPLRAEFNLKRPGRHRWEQRDLGDGRWEVRLSNAGPVTPASAAAMLAGALESRARRMTVKRRRVLVELGADWPYIGVVESGILAATLTTAMGREQTMYEVLTGDIFGEVALIDGGYAPLRFVAVTNDTVVLLFPSDAVRALAAAAPQIASALGVVAAQRFRAVVERFAAHLSQTTTARVAQALLAYASPEIGLRDALDPLPTLTQNEIAMRAGTVKEVVSRALAELETAGALRRDGGHIAALDRVKLLAASEGDMHPS
ncbi:MAG: DUF2249 domain-containing protein [Candidatus Aquilonibacter sp.]